MADKSKKKTAKKAPAANNKVAQLEARIAKLEQKLNASAAPKPAPRPAPAGGAPRPQMAGAPRPPMPGGPMQRPQMPGMGQRGAPNAAPRPMTPRMPS